MKNDLLPVGLIFTVFVYLLTIYPQQVKNSNRVHSELLQAKETAIYYYDLAESLEASLVSLNAEIDSLEDTITSLQETVYSPELAKLIKIKEDLRGYSVEERATALTVAWTESSWRLNPNHNDNGFTVGPCGVKEYHIDYLKSLNINRYSFASCIELYKLFKERNNGSSYLAIKSYKGIVKNTYLIDRYYELRTKILKILKD